MKCYKKGEKGSNSGSSSSRVTSKVHGKKGEKVEKVTQKSNTTRCKKFFVLDKFSKKCENQALELSKDTIKLKDAITDKLYYINDLMITNFTHTHYKKHVKETLDNLNKTEKAVKNLAKSIKQFAKKYKGVDHKKSHSHKHVGLKTISAILMKFSESLKLEDLSELHVVVDDVEEKILKQIAELKKLAKDVVIDEDDNIDEFYEENWYEATNELNQC
jgi:hypothetical protein